MHTYFSFGLFLQDIPNSITPQTTLRLLPIPFYPPFFFPVQDRGTGYNSLLWMCTLNTLTWPVHILHISENKTHTNAGTHIYPHTHKHTNTYSQVYIWMQTHTCTQCTYTCKYAYTHTHVHVCIHAQTHTHTHMCTILITMRECSYHGATSRSFSNNICLKLWRDQSPQYVLTWSCPIRIE